MKCGKIHETLFQPDLNTSLILCPNGCGYQGHREVTPVPPKPQAPAAPNPIAHPPYYGGESDPFEAIKVIEAMGWGRAFCLGNVLKYVIRAGRKPGATEAEDLAKAEWYMRRACELAKKAKQAKESKP